MGAVIQQSTTGLIGPIQVVEQPLLWLQVRRRNSFAQLLAPKPKIEPRPALRARHVQYGPRLNPRRPYVPRDMRHRFET